jgi:hypothetical protein
VKVNPKETAMRRIKHEGWKTVFVRGLKIGIAGAIAIGLLAVVVANIRPHSLVTQAVAAKPVAESYRENYFPAQFAAPQGEIERQPETF